MARVTLLGMIALLVLVDGTKGQGVAVDRTPGRTRNRGYMASSYYTKGNYWSSPLAGSMRYPPSDPLDLRSPSVMMGYLRGLAPHSFDRAGYPGFLTRAQLLRDMMAPEVRYTGALRWLPAREADNPPSRVGQILHRRNLLKPKSMLAKVMVSNSADRAYMPAPLPTTERDVADTARAGPEEPQPSVPTEPDAAEPSLNERMQARLDDRLGSYYTAGIQYYQEGDYRRAENYFEMIRTLDRASPRGFLLCGVTAYTRVEYERAAMNLSLAFQKASSLEELKIDLSVFYPRRETFEQALDRINVLAHRKEPPPPPHFLIIWAYYAWLNNDAAAAASACAAAETVFPDAERAGVTRFRELLSAARTSEVGAR